MKTSIKNDWLYAEFASSGAELRKVTHKKNGLEYMWTGDSAYWGRVSPVLFPIVGRLKNDSYQLQNKSYSMSQHGFLRDVEFQAEEQTEDAITFVFSSEGRYLDVYPYDFKAYIHYELKEDTLLVKWEIVNVNNEEMYFSIGAHPAFRVPMAESDTVSGYQLSLTPAENNQVMEYELKNSLIHEKGPAGNIQSIGLDAELFANDAIVFSHIDKVSLTSTHSGRGVDVLLKNFPFVGIWSRYMEDGTMAPFVCIEPWYGIADTHDASGKLNEKFGINKLEKGSTFQAEYQITFK